MTFRTFFQRVVLLTFCLSGLTTFAQQFTVQSVTGNQFDLLDETILVTYSVLLTGSSVTNVVPRLTPPACSYDSSGNSYFSTSYAGADGSSTPGRISNWTVGTTRNVSFYVHLYNEGGVCGAGLGSICSQAQTLFDLSFTHSGSTAPISAPSTSFLLMNLPSSDVRLDLSPPVYTWDPDFCLPFQQAGQSFEGDFTFGSLNFDENDPNQRVILAMDWYAFRFPGEDVPTLFQLFNQFLVFINPGGNFINMTIESFLGNLDLVDLPIFSHTGAPLANAPYGGGGGLDECETGAVSTNYWDISDLQTNNITGFPVRENIAPDTNGTATPNAFHQEVFGPLVPALFRSINIYTATQTLCGAAASVFGAPPADFGFTQFSIDVDGTTSATIDVPNAWGTSVLGTGFDMEWYLRSDTVFEPIPVTNSKVLTVNFNLFNMVPAGSDPTDFQIEARVKYDPDGGSTANASYVSTFSPFHTLSYNFSGATYENEEMQPDNFLDPGEVANVTYNLVNNSNLGISNLELIISNPNPNNQLLYNGTLLDGPLVQSFGTMNPGQTLPVLMALNLIQVDPALICGNLELQVETSFTHDGVAQTFVDLLDIPVNCEGSVADNYLDVDPTPAVINCGTPISVVVNNQSFTYQFRFYTSLEALISNTVSEINGSGVWAEPVLPTDPEVLPLTYYVSITAANLNETRRIATVSIQAIDDGNCDPCGPFDINNDEMVDASDFGLNAAQTWNTGGMLDLVEFIIDSGLAGCLSP